MNEQRAFVIRIIPFSEADLIVSLIDETGGFVSAVARSARRSQKRFGGGLLEPTNLLKVNLSEYERGGLYVLQEARLERCFDGLRSSYERMQISAEITKLIDRLSKKQSTDIGLFKLFGHTLEQLETAQTPATVYLHFLSRFLTQQGILVVNSSAVDWFAKTPMHRHADFIASDFQLQQILVDLENQLKLFLSGSTAY